VIQEQDDAKKRKPSETEMKKNVETSPVLDAQIDRKVFPFGKDHVDARTDFVVGQQQHTDLERDRKADNKVREAFLNHL
jgi:hypothetical protein